MKLNSLFLLVLIITGSYSRVLEAPKVIRSLEGAALNSTQTANVPSGPRPLSVFMGITNFTSVAEYFGTDE
jgi:hypothetical protein